MATKPSTIKDRLPTFGLNVAALPAGLILASVADRLGALIGGNPQGMIVIYGLAVLLVFVGIASPLALLPTIWQRLLGVPVGGLLAWYSIPVFEMAFRKATTPAPAVKEFIMAAVTML